MLGDFKKLFREKHDANTKIPKGILQYMSYSLPNGYDYIDIGNGFCMMNTHDGLKIRGVLRIDGSTHENIIKCKSFDDLIKYSTNLQKPIFLDPYEDGKYYVDDKKYSLDDIITSPLTGLKMEEGKLMYIPPKFNQSFDLVFTSNNKEKKVKMERVPFDSVEYMKFQNVYEDGLSIVLKAKMQSVEMGISIKTDIVNAKSVSNVCECLYWYNEFAKGNVKLYEEVINKDNVAGLTPYEDDAVEFWNQLLKIEEIFKVAFDVSGGVYTNDVKKIRQLYTSLVLGKPYKEDESVSTLSGNGGLEPVGDFSSITDKGMYFRFLKHESSIIMGCELNYLAVKYILGEKVKSYKIDEESGDFELIMEQAYEEISPFTSTRYFINEESLNSFLEKEDDYKNDFLNADYIEEILDDEE